MNKRSFVSRVAAGAALALPVVAFAAVAPIDVTPATEGITAAQVACVAVLGAMISMGAVLYGLKRVKRLIGG